MTKSGDILELLKNEYFVQWIVAPTEESTHFWSNWISAHPERKQDVEMAVRIIKSGKYEVDESMPEDYYHQVMENLINHSIGSRSKKKTTVWKFWKPLGIAASIGLVIYSLMLTSQDRFFSEEDDAVVTTLIQKEAPMGTKVTTRMPDGSIVTLNSDTRITFPEQFTENAREVSLSGEAFFEVEHNPDKPFFVNLNGDKVRVLGTSFNVRCYPEDSVVHVAVATGRVSYTITSGERVILAPDQMATHFPFEGKLTTGDVDRLYAFGWKDKIIYFKGSTFNEIIIELKRWYDIEFELNGDFSHWGTYSGEFENPSLSEVLNGLSFVYRFDFKIDGSKVTLTSTTK